MVLTAIALVIGVVSLFAGPIAGFVAVLAAGLVQLNVVYAWLAGPRMMAERRLVLVPGVLAGIPFAMGAYALFGGVGAIIASLPAAAARHDRGRHDALDATRLTLDGDDRLLPGGRPRADQQLCRHRRRAARARAPRRLHPRGVVRRHARGARVRGAAHAPRPAAGAGGGARAVLDRLHPRHGAGLPQADDRATRRVRRTDVRGALRRLALRARAPARDHRRARPRRDRRGQRRLVPGARREWSPLGAHRLVQPTRGA